jgi:hypothetical protein
MLIEAIGGEARFDLSRSDRVNSPAQRVANDVAFRVALDVGCNSHQIDTAQRRFGRLLSMGGLENFVPQNPIAMDLPGEFRDIDRE